MPLLGQQTADKMDNFLLDPEKTKEITNLILCWLREEIFKDPTSQIAIIGASMIAKAKAGEDGLLRGAPMP